MFGVVLSSIRASKACVVSVGLGLCLGLFSIRAPKACVVYVGVVCLLPVSQKACVGGSFFNIRASKAYNYSVCLG